MKISEAQARVRAFMEMANRAGAKQVIGETPAVRDARLRWMLIQEEAGEAVDALHNEDLIELADGLADLLYVILGTAVSCGIELEPIFQEVCRSNDTKEGGPVVDGKLLKPDHYEPPRIAEELERQGWRR